MKWAYRTIGIDKNYASCCFFIELVVIVLCRFAVLIGHGNGDFRLGVYLEIVNQLVSLGTYSFNERFRGETRRWVPPDHFEDDQPVAYPNHNIAGFGFAHPRKLRVLVNEASKVFVAA